MGMMVFHHPVLGKLSWGRQREGKLAGPAASGKTHKARPVRPGKTRPCPPPSFHFQPQMRPPEGRCLLTLEGRWSSGREGGGGQGGGPSAQDPWITGRGGTSEPQTRPHPPIGWSVCSLTAPDAVCTVTPPSPSPHPWPGSWSVPCLPVLHARRGGLPRPPPGFRTPLGSASVTGLDSPLSPLRAL